MGRPGGSGTPFDFLDRPGPSAASFGSPDIGLSAPVPGVRFRPPQEELPDLRVGVAGSVRNGSDDFGLASFGYDPRAAIEPPIDLGYAGGHRSDGIYPSPYPAYDPTYFPAPPRDFVREALDQIVRIYSRAKSDRFFDQSTLNDPLAVTARPVGARFVGGLPLGHAYPPTSPSYDPTYFPAPPRDFVREALDQIVRIYSGAKRDRLFDQSTLNDSPAITAPPVGARSVGGLSLDHAYPSTSPAYDPTYFLAPPRDFVREALDQIAWIYGGVHGDRFFDRQSSHTDPSASVGGGLLPASGDAMDPQYIVPVNRPIGPPPRGMGDNSRQAPKQGPSSPPQPQPQAPRGAPGTPPPPDAAGPAAAADAAEWQRAATYNTYREQLQALDPENPLLKLEPAPGAVPDRVTIDRYGEEVKGIVRRRIEQTIKDLSSRSTYDHRSAVRTIGGDVDLRAEFERLKIGGKRVYGGRGQHGEGGDGELYELPGGMRVGFRMANDTRTGQKRSIPTLDIRYQGQRLRFHYNNQR
jgi:hypothetical protein